MYLRWSGGMLIVWLVLWFITGLAPLPALLLGAGTIAVFVLRVRYGRTSADSWGIGWFSRRVALQLLIAVGACVAVMFATHARRQKVDRVAAVVEAMGVERRAHCVRPVGTFSPAPVGICLAPPRLMDYLDREHRLLPFIYWGEVAVLGSLVLALTRAVLCAIEARPSATRRRQATGRL